MVVRRDGSHKGKLGKKIIRTLAAGAVVVPGLLGGQLATVDNIASAGTINVTSPQSLTLKYGQTAKLDFEAYTFRTSSKNLQYRSDCEGNHYLDANMPGTYTVYVYDTDIYYSDNNSIGSFIVNVPYPDHNHDGVVDISDIVKNLAQHQYDSNERRGLLDLVESSLKPINEAPTVNDEHIFTYGRSIHCFSSFSLDDLFVDEEGSELTYSLVGTTPASLRTLLATDGERNDVLYYQFLKTGTTTVTVRATDYYGASINRALIFEWNREYDMHGEENIELTPEDLIYNLGIGELESIEHVVATKVVNHPSNMGTIDFQAFLSDGSIYIAINENVPVEYELDPDYDPEYGGEYQDEFAVAVIKVDITTNLKTYTEYFKIKAFNVNVEQPD